MADHDSAREMADRLLATLGFTSKLFTTDELEAKRQRVLGVGLREMVEGGSPTLVATLKCQLRELRQRVAELESAGDAEMERVKACEHIAEGDEGWERLENLCPSTAAVALLRRENERLRKALEGAERFCSMTTEWMARTPERTRILMTGSSLHQHLVEVTETLRAALRSEEPSDV